MEDPEQHGREWQRRNGVRSWSGRVGRKPATGQVAVNRVEWRKIALALCATVHLGTDRIDDDDDISDLLLQRMFRNFQTSLDF